MILKICLHLLGFLALASATCPRSPPPSVSRYPKSPGDNGFKIILNGDPERYVPGTPYTVTLVGSRTHDYLQHFARFSITAEPRDPNKESTPLTHGQFHLFADTMSTFNQDCVNSIKETNDLPKTEVQVMWKAPKAGSGCVIIKAMVFEHPRRWFADDGQLSRQICEQPPGTIVSPNEDDCCACDEAKYEMVFEGIWSKETHPKDFPSLLQLTHFSDVIGASHVKNFTFWGEGEIASDGFRSLAEWGSVRLMEQELRQQSKYLKTIIKAAGLWYPKVNSKTSTTFKVDNKRHLVSLASMLGPTPDWVVGVSGYDLCEKSCTWKENVTVDLYPYDAGTDSGITYMSPNEETSPREKMFKITTKYPEDPRAPFYDMHSDDMVPLARLYLKRLEVIPKPCDEKALEELTTIEVSDNIEDAVRPECGVTEYSEWTPCSVTCGKGLRTRTREYTMPMEKVKMFGCNRQLVSREMCVADVPECENNGNEGPRSNEDIGEEDEGVCTTGRWGSWSECSATCGVGFLMRTRKFLDRMGLKKCPHVSLVEKEKCMGPPCPEGLDKEDPDCPVTPWSDWSSCSVTCGRGIRVRMRLLLVPDPEKKEECSGKVELTQHAPCTDRADCNLDMATAKEVCMENTDAGLCRGSYERWSFNTQKAMCVPFIYKGCKGNRNNFLTEEDCMNTCSIVRDILIGNPSPSGILSSPSQIAATNLEIQDCVVTNWSEWSHCSATCGDGFVESVRMIKVPASNGGFPCPRKLSKRRRCTGPPCFRAPIF